MAERPDFYDLIAQNRRRTWVLMFSFFVLLALVGIAVSIIVGGGLIGVMFAVTLSFGISFSSYFSSASIASPPHGRNRPPEKNSGACTIWSRRSRSLPVSPSRVFTSSTTPPPTPSPPAATPTTPQLPSPRA